MFAARAFYEHHGWLADGGEKMFEMGGERLSRGALPPRPALSKLGGPNRDHRRGDRGGGPGVPGGRPASKPGAMPAVGPGESPTHVLTVHRARARRAREAAPVAQESGRAGAQVLDCQTRRHISGHEQPGDPDQDQEHRPAVGVVQAACDDRRRGPRPAAARGRQVGVLPRRPHHQHAAHEEAQEPHHLQQHDPLQHPGRLRHDIGRSRYHFAAHDGPPVRSAFHKATQVTVQPHSDHSLFVSVPRPSGEGDQVAEIVAPGVLHPFGHEDDVFGRESLHRAWVMGDEHDGAGIGVQRLQHLAAARRIEVVRRLVQQENIRR